MTEQELIKRIDRISGQHIVGMSNESLKMLTSNFKESLVRRLVSKGSSLRDQVLILDTINGTINDYYRVNYSNIKDWIINGREAVNNIRFDLECGILITVGKETDDIGKEISDAENNTTAEKYSEKRAALEARIKELEEENKELKEQLTQKPTAIENTEAMKSLEDENERLRKESEEMTIELLKSIFYETEKDVKEFLKKIDGRPDTEIIDTVCEFLNGRKISDKSKGRPLWKILHAAKYYSSTESNWNTALRNHP